MELWTPTYNWFFRAHFVNREIGIIPGSSQVNRLSPETHVLVCDSLVKSAIIKFICASLNLYFKLNWLSKFQIILDFGTPKQPNILTHRIHVWYIYLDLVKFYGTCR